MGAHGRVCICSVRVPPVSLSLDATVERACGVTRCRDFDARRGRSYEEHVRLGDDAGLRFHTDAGASLGELVRGYRHGDAQNQGIGVLITYELDGRSPVGTGSV